MAWTCHRTGECCRSVSHVVMTTQERDLVIAAAPQIQATWEDHPKPGFVSLVAGPCPYLVGNLCGVHASRPTNCRKFACFRESKAEPLSALLMSHRGESIPVKTLTDRSARRQWQHMVNKAERYARSHGWTA